MKVGGHSSLLGRGARAAALVALALVLAACGRAEATTTTSSADAVVVVGRSVDAGEAGAPRTTARADAGPTAEDTILPPANSEELAARMRHLLEAIAQGNAELANDAIFPRDAYLLLRDGADPAKAWEKKVSLPFHKSVEKLHKTAVRNGRVANAKFVGFELGHSVQQVTPKKKDWKSPVWRVKGSKLTFVVDGRPHTVRIAEMVAFRGAWYVTKLR